MVGSGYHRGVLKDKIIDDTWSAFVLDMSEGFTQAGFSLVNPDLCLGSPWGSFTVEVPHRGSWHGVCRPEAVYSERRGRYKHRCVNLIGYRMVPRCSTVCEASAIFRFGHSLYVDPSDMLLQIGRMAAYNNDIVIAISNMNMGRNQDVSGVVVCQQLTGVSPLQRVRTSSNQTQSERRQRMKYLIRPISKNSMKRIKRRSLLAASSQG